MRNINGGGVKTDRGLLRFERLKEFGRKDADAGDAPLVEIVKVVC